MRATLTTARSVLPSPGCSSATFPGTILRYVSCMHLSATSRIADVRLCVCVRAQNNVYGMFPFFTPDVTKTNLSKLGIADQYTFERPVAKPVEKIVDNVKDIGAILKDTTGYRTVESEVFAQTASKFSVVANACVFLYAGNHERAEDWRC